MSFFRGGVMEFTASESQVARGGNDDGLEIEPRDGVGSPDRGFS